jgi:hypothetical protein|tara:strand:- start:430 stop:765 length:336 start_codon:yes stop_codon:yes gene_type:complete
VANFFKSETFNLTTTNLTTVLSIATSAVAIVRSVQASHDSASNVDVDLFLKKSGGSDVEIAHAQLNKTTTNLAQNVINLEGGDILKIQAGTANEITGQISYLLIDRSQENG